MTSAAGVTASRGPKSMTFTLKIETSNAAFYEPGAELARILKELSERAADLNHVYDDRGALRDVNGNTVGTWTYKAEKEAA